MLGQTSPMPWIKGLKYQTYILDFQSTYTAHRTRNLGEIQHLQRRMFLPVNEFDFKWLADDAERETYQMMYSKIPLSFRKTVPLSLGLSNLVRLSLHRPSQNNL